MRSKPSNAVASYSLPAFHAPECVLVAIALLARTAQFRTELSRSFRVLAQTSRILLTPDPRLTDDFVLIRAGEMPQKSLANFFVNERGKASAFWAPPGVQLNHILAVIDASLK